MVDGFLLVFTNSTGVINLLVKYTSLDVSSCCRLFLDSADVGFCGTFEG